MKVQDWLCLGGTETIVGTVICAAVNMDSPATIPTWAIEGSLAMGTVSLLAAILLQLRANRGVSVKTDSDRAVAKMQALRQQNAKIRADLEKIENVTRYLVDAVEQVTERGPSPGIKPDGSGGFTGLFATDYFEPYAVCPACGLEALHPMRIPHPDEGHDETTKTLKYWASQNKQGHAMRDFECIRTCRSCEVHWGQNALGIFPPPMLGPFRPTAEDLANNRQYERLSSSYRQMMEDDVNRFTPVVRVPLAQVGHIDDVRLIATGDVGMIDGVVIPPLARAKDSTSDRKIYKDNGGKLFVVVNGMVLARKETNGTWVVPTNPTRWAGPDDKPKSTDLVTANEAAERNQQYRNGEAWMDEFYAAKNDETDYEAPDALRVDTSPQAITEAQRLYRDLFKQNQDRRVTQERAAHVAQDFEARKKDLRDFGTPDHPADRDQ